MKQWHINQFRRALQSNFECRKAEFRYLSNFLTSLIVCTSVKLSEIAKWMSPEVKTESNYRGLQRFFQKYGVCYQQYAGYVMSHLPKGKRFYLVMDRTNWKFGKANTNILMLGIIYAKMCFPLYWMCLDKGGSSSFWERKDLLDKAIEMLGKERIKALLGDREFIGVKWFKYLIDKEIEFHIRLPKSIKAGSVLSENRKSITHVFRYWKEGVKIDYHKKLDICGFKLYLSGMRSSKDYCIIVSSKNNLNSLEKYQLRWTIECMFQAFKSRGFNFEDTHMKQLEKIEKLIVLVSIVYTWCVLIGLLNEQALTIKLKNDGRRRTSVFRKGLNYLTAIIIKMLRGEIYNILEFNEVTQILSCP